MRVPDVAVTPPWEHEFKSQLCRFPAWDLRHSASLSLSFLLCSVGDRTLLRCSEEPVTLRLAGCPACSEPRGTLVPLPLLPASLEDRARKSKCRAEEGVTGPEAGGWRP